MNRGWQIHDAGKSDSGILLAASDLADAGGETIEGQGPGFQLNRLAWRDVVGVFFGDRDLNIEPPDIFDDTNQSPLFDELSRALLQARSRNDAFDRGFDLLVEELIVKERHCFGQSGPAGRFRFNLFGPGTGFQQLECRLDIGQFFLATGDVRFGGAKAFGLQAT